MRDALAPFDDLYRDSPDPWGTETRWYERRKRTLLLAALPRERYGAAFEAACGTGHISAALAGRCDTVLAGDGSENALTVARHRLAEYRNVTVEAHRLPEGWPARAFDLVVLSEILYFLDADAGVRVAASARDSAGTSGLVVACDWRDAIAGRGVTGEEAHRRFETALGLPRCFEYVDRDFVLSGWSRDEASVANREGLR